jgi:ribonuclease D
MSPAAGESAAPSKDERLVLAWRCGLAGSATKPRRHDILDMDEQIITTPDALAVCCGYLAEQTHFGFDTEFVGEDSYHPRLCLVQVATDERLFLLDPLSCGPLDAFWKLVVDPARTVVVHAGREEVRLCRLGTGSAPGNLFDLQIAAGLTNGVYPMGHGNLVHQVLGVSLSKGETLTEWRERPLTPSQIRYAFDDVRYLLPLWKKLAQRLEKMGRTDWAREEFLRMARAAAPEEPSQEKWRKLRGLGSLDRRRLAVVRALYNWREALAATTNRPTRAIIRDDLIIEIAKRNPVRERDLQVVRGLPKRDLAAIVAVVEQARALPPEDLPIASDREQDPQPVTLAANVLNAALGDMCAKMRLAQNLVANSNDIKVLVRAKLAGAPLPEDSQLTHGWRREHLLPELLALLDGRRVLRIADLKADGPFAYGDAL